ncbi:hypothetical protein VCHC69A1_1477B, partial [Vibrio cholerae HC-69A1]
GKPKRVGRLLETQRVLNLCPSKRARQPNPSPVIRWRFLMSLAKICLPISKVLSH